MCRMALNYVLIKVCTVCVKAFVMHQVLHAYIRTDFTLVLKIRSLDLMEMTCEVQMGLRVLNVAVAFPILL